MKWRGIAAAVVCLAAAGCEDQDARLTEAKTVATLTASFADEAWSGQKIPDKQWCRRFGGEGATPPLTIADLPEGATHVIVEFNDETYEPMNNGGHGALRFAIPQGRSSVSLPPIPGETEDLPAGVAMLKAHAAPNWSGTGGAYLPPCSGGRGNSYSATIKAVTLAPDGKTGTVLGKGKIALGAY